MLYKDGKGTWRSKDADTKGTYGIIEGVVRTSADMTTDEINATVNAFIKDHKEPRTSVSIKGVELSQITGVALDRMTVGKLYRLALPDYGITVERNITSVEWDDVYGDPLSMIVNLGDEEDTVVTFLHNLDSKGYGGGGGGRAADTQLSEIKNFYTEFYKDDKRIELIATQAKDSGEILKQAGMKLNSKRVLIYATDNEKNIMTKELLNEVLDIVYTEKIREDEAGLLRGLLSAIVEAADPYVGGNAIPMISEWYTNTVKIRDTGKPYHAKVKGLELSAVYSPDSGGTIQIVMDLV